MTIPLTFKKLGDKWYLDIEHSNPKNIYFGGLVDRVFNIIDKYDVGTISIQLIRSDYTDDKKYLIQFTDSDMLKYFTTNEDFLMDIYIGKHKFKIHRKTYAAIEKKYDADFHMLLYKLNIINEADY